MKKITTAEELDALPDGAKVRDRDGDVWEHWGGEWHTRETRPFDSAWLCRKWAPLTVLPDTAAPTAEDQADDVVRAANLQALIDEMHAEPIRRTAADDLDPAAEVERLRAALTTVAITAWGEGHRVGWEHCQDGNYGTDYWDDDTRNPYAQEEDR